MIINHNNVNLLEVNLFTIIPKEYLGKRLDQTLAILFPSYSRENFRQWILNQNCLIDGQPKSPKFKLKGGEKVIIKAKLQNRHECYSPEDLPINIVYEDPELLMINKPNGLVVHPGSGNWSGTLLNRLINYLPSLKFIPRAGIIHRLDRDTSGLMMIAKTLNAYNNLILQFKNRLVNKFYLAIVNGNLTHSGSINAPIGRNRSNRIKMQVTNNGKPALTKYNILKKFKNHTYIKVKIETGRTHQIRVHMQHINHPILGDQLYGKNNTIGKIKQTIARQALHATELNFKHPADHREMNFTLDLPEDLTKILTILDNETLN